MDGGTLAAGALVQEARAPNRKTAVKTAITQYLFSSKYFMMNSLK
jgi:hypothetical protein